MKRNKKKIGAVILALLAILLILNLVFLFKEKREYNADFESINHSFIFFTKDFVKW